MTFLACVLLVVIFALLAHLSDIGQAAPRSESDPAPKRRRNPPAPSGPAFSKAPSPATIDTDTLSPEAETIYARLRSDGASEVYARAYANAHVAHLARGFSGSGAAVGDFDEHVDERYDLDDDEAEGDEDGFESAWRGDDPFDSMSDDAFDDDMEPDAVLRHLLDHEFDDDPIASTSSGINAFDSGFFGDHGFDFDAGLSHVASDAGCTWINPASGLPMTGDGLCGVDVAGNPFGFSHSDP